MADSMATVSADNTTAAPGDSVLLNFYADLNGLPRVNEECTLTGILYTWNDGAQGETDSVSVQIPETAVDQSVYQFTRTVNVQFVSSCPLNPAAGTGTATVTVIVPTFCPSP